MGSAVARRLLDCGHPVSVRDVRPDAEAPLARAGARICASPAAVAAGCDVVITLVVDAAQTDEVLFGPDGVVAGAGKEVVVVVMSTLSPAFVAAAAARLAAAGIAFVDSPCSGGPARARAGEMSTMIAADPALLARHAPLLASLSSRRFVVGDRPGDGARMKVVNNLLAGANLVAAAEAMDLGVRLGLDARRLFEVVSESSGASWIFGDRMSRVLAGDREAKARLDILRKDLSLAVEAARDTGSPGTMARAAARVFDEASAAGMGDEDDSALVDWYARGAGEN